MKGEKSAQGKGGEGGKKSINMTQNKTSDMKMMIYFKFPLHLMICQPNIGGTNNPKWKRSNQFKKQERSVRLLT